uniref:Secreted protein n=1 Tax=Trypanosoma vivax (strain Y486) TaxID=1055687 RepID=G0U1J9_TRYVY|nr:hypothetical protein TVY486_0805630 [Trypanosoma vivax Y486]
MCLLVFFFLCCCRCCCCRCCCLFGCCVFPFSLFGYHPYRALLIRQQWNRLYGTWSVEYCQC